MNNIDVVYTPWSNLKKAASMDVGQVGFHNPKMVGSPLFCSMCIMLSGMLVSFVDFFFFFLNLFWLSMHEK